MECPTDTANRERIPQYSNMLQHWAWHVIMVKKRWAQMATAKQSSALSQQLLTQHQQPLCCLNGLEAPLSVGTDVVKHQLKDVSPKRDTMKRYLPALTD